YAANDMFIAIFLQVILIFLNAVFASAEIAVLSTNTAKLEKLSEEGNKKAKRLLALTSNSSKFLSTIQVAITLAGLLGSAYAADNFAEPLVALLLSLGIALSEETLKTVCVFLITILLSFFSIVFGELVPKRVAMKHAEKMALGLSGLLTFVSGFFAPFVWILTKSTNAMLRLFGINPNEEEEAPTEEEIIMMVESGNEGGTIDSEEHEMIQNVFAFDDTSVSEVCTHRPDVAFLCREDSLEEWKKTIASTGHTYYPVIGENADTLLGVLNAKKLYFSEYQTVDEVIEHLLEKPYLIPESIKADTLLRNMRRMRNYFAVVIDEYGGTSGVVTVKDLFELLVGDINETEEEAVEEIRKLSDSKWQIRGSASVDEVQEALALQFAYEECETFGGYVLGLLGTVPEDGTVMETETECLHISVDLVEDRRIVLTTVTKK
ncbi:MAG: HlyC/CorC family transporter, partial [Clostridia bacterium]|nr:HlyC/CorC family transporter [Clostridia bacterium]